MRLRPRGQIVIDGRMRTLTRIDTRARSNEGWVALPLLVRGLEEGQRVALETAGRRYLIGHAVRMNLRWWFVVDWGADDADDLPLYDVQ